ncbi:MAG: ATP phosphoribosyltransferase [Syntrophotalea acetylenica]|jgi:ATP phosphoribosyltransferase|uniref:ATP phosphoribosyltransferase n=1 Tax=Syntrophotalea acetylenica TaxID=29542 RepID=A0A1L3GEM8_SYNAC|nr:ATP phosphoribosyltransferase [Syntrophotalea acetylenica]APG24390.1 ATP phosphoribosyltransferase [Syntrophotalea acetylenica]APG44972.1 ATP phosphoribosyltransferase [Syntrophotalea acetylenica]MDD4457178.1 ATP phosphoribosyltransferase [Syntrophotalea acetylenica]MDY0262441.1 ATP phosphoribosyltransferase [Syntrophotalea acetylenica]
MSDYITFALPKGRIMQDSMELFAKIGITCPEMQGDSRKLVFENPETKFRFMAVRATDVPTYVEYGCADLGVVGKDTLLEQGKDLYEPLDLKFGYCRLVVAEPGELLRDEDPASWSNIRVATKYPNVTERFFAGRGVQVELIKLYGSIELAPLVGLAERIVDLVSTGATMRENGLVEVETIAEITSRLIVNRASLKTKHQRITRIIQDLEKVLAAESANG